jgi:hypothetical protein
MEEKFNNIINVPFIYDAPDDYLSQTNALGKTGNWVYNGPDKIWTFVNKEALIYEGRYLTEKDDGANVPTPEHQYKVEIDCSTNPLLCTIIGADEIRDYNLLDQYEETMPDGKVYNRPLTPPPDHTYELQEIIYNPGTGDFNKPYPWKKPHMHWDLMRLWRNNQLAATDHQGAAYDMPAGLKAQWDEYRQALRDMPQLHGATNTHYNIVLSASAPINTAGQRVIKLSSVAGISVGDDVGVKVWPVENIFEDHTHVASINSSAKTITLDKDLIKTPTESNKELAFSPCPVSDAWKVSPPDHPFEGDPGPAIPAELRNRV